MDLFKKFDNEHIRSTTFNLFKTYEKDIYTVISKIIHIIVILIFMYLIIRIGYKLIDRAIEKQHKFRFSLDEKKSKTMGELFKSILKYTVYFIGITDILTKVIGKVSITFAGVSGVALLGFGAQSLIKDVINGIFILFENQFSVGDYITIENKTGYVESVELRVTRIKDSNGDVHIIPNGSIQKVTNHSMGFKGIIVDIIISYEEDLDKTISIIEDACNEFKLESKNIVEGPKVYGVVSFQDYGVTIRVNGKAKPLTQVQCEVMLRKRIKTELDKNNIKMGYPIVNLQKGE